MPIAFAHKLLAKWRREGRGIWYVKLIVEGYDDVFTYMYPGGHSRKFVVKAARIDCAQELGEKLKFVHLQSAERKS